MIDWTYIAPFSCHPKNHITLDGRVNDDASHFYRIESSEDDNGRPVFYLTVFRAVTGKAIDATPSAYYSVNKLKAIAANHFEHFGWFTQEG